MKPVWIGLTYGLIGFVLGGAAGHFGPVPPLPLIPERREPVDMDVQEGVAIHEAGHALARAYLQGADKVQRIDVYTSLSQGGSYGATTPRTRPEFSTRDQLMQAVIIRLAGRAADALVGAGPDTGAETDLDAATAEMKRMYATSGLGGSLLTRDPDALPEEMLRRLEAELDVAYQCAEAIIALNRPATEALANALLAQPNDHHVLTVDADEFQALLGEYPLSVLEPSDQARMHAACRPSEETLKRVPKMCPRNPVPAGAGTSRPK